MDVDSDRHSEEPGPQAAGAEALQDSAPVSFSNEQLLLVDSNDRVLGYGSKARLHAGEGLLHRAFSVFLFDQQRRLLVHRRSAAKPLWPGYWTNSCCSHPRRGEALETAVFRRIHEELGVEVTVIEASHRFEYRARYESVGSEHELCHVFLAQLPIGASPVVHPEEISDWCWLHTTEVDHWMVSYPEQLTPWSGRSGQHCAVPVANRWSTSWKQSSTRAAPLEHAFLQNRCRLLEPLTSENPPRARPGSRPWSPIPTTAGPRRTRRTCAAGRNDRRL